MYRFKRNLLHGQSPLYFQFLSCGQLLKLPLPDKPKMLVRAKCQLRQMDERKSSAGFNSSLFRISNYNKNFSTSSIASISPSSNVVSCSYCLEETLFDLVSYICCCCCLWLAAGKSGAVSFLGQLFCFSYFSSLAVFRRGGETFEAFSSS